MTQRFASLVVCTKDRPAGVALAARSILASEHRNLELIVVDQSDSHETEKALASCSSDERFRYVRSLGRGKGVALNEALTLASADIVVCTDDDCEAPSDWLGGMVAAFDASPRIAVVYSNVVAGDFDPVEGYIPTYVISSNRLLKSVAAARRGLGIGAGMAFRRDVMQAMGGFDESLGPGARFMACDDWDIALRSLLKGWAVYQTSEVAVVHHGFRRLAQGREHNYRDWMGVGATFGKFIRAGHPSVIVPGLWILSRYALLPPLRNLVRLQRPRGLMRVTAFARGMAAGLFTKVDRATMTFIP
jgi:glycosyltransferase involved in cell wall biosynthesis